MTVFRTKKEFIEATKGRPMMHWLDVETEAQRRNAEERRAERQLSRFRERLETAQAECDRFAARFAGDPAGALEWANGVQGAAVKVKIYTSLIAMVATAKENGATATETLKRVLELATTNVLRKARYSNYNSSMFANIMAEAEMNFWAELAENTFW